MKSKHGNHMATKPLGLAPLSHRQLDDVKELFKQGASESTTEAVLADVIYQALESRFTEEYSWEGVPCQTFIPGLMSLSQEMAERALQVMDARLKEFLHHEFGDLFMDAICLAGEDANATHAAKQKALKAQIALAASQRHAKPTPD